jgi:hypothetical protein
MSVTTPGPRRFGCGAKMTNRLQIAYIARVPMQERTSGKVVLTSVDP